VLIIVICPKETELQCLDKIPTENEFEYELSLRGEDLWDFARGGESGLSEVYGARRGSD